jgi:hypothetical protein
VTATPVADASQPRSAAPVRADRTPRSRSWLMLTALVVVLCLPLLVALGYLHHPRWYPLLDWAQTEIRIRDITHGHPPLIGLAGRIGPFGPNGGSHPGPISFYLLWPAWALFGGAAYGMYVGNVMLDIAAVSLCMWIAYRRGGLAMAISIAFVLAIVMRAYGAFMLTLPWNPYLPVLWWCVVLLAVWSLFCDDLVMLPIAAFAGTFCVQTHISYLGLVGGLGVFALGVLVVRHARARDAADKRRELMRYGIVAVAIVVVLWIPPFVDEFTRNPGNLSTIRDYFSNPPDPPIGLREGVDVLLTQLNPARLFGSVLITDGARTSASGARWPAVVTIIAWLTSVAGAWRLRARAILRLDAVLGIALALGVFSAARIFGKVWFYLLLWAIPLVAFMLFTIGWTIVEAIRARAPETVAKFARPALAVLLAGIVLVTGVATVWAADNVDVMSPRMNAQLAALTKPTVAELQRLTENGLHGPIYVSWLPEPQNIGAEGYGLLNELLRHNFDVKADVGFRPGATRAHVLDPARMSVQVHLATGVDIARWQRDPRFQQLAYYDPRSPAERVESDRLHAQAVEALKREGRADLLQDLDDNTFVLLLNNDLSAPTQRIISDMLALGLPAAVFIGPVAEPPG